MPTYQEVIDNDLFNMDQEQVLRFLRQAEAAGVPADTINQWYKEWKLVYADRETQQGRADAREANDPMLNMAYGAGGMALGAGGTALLQDGIPAVFNGIFGTGGASEVAPEIAIQAAELFSANPAQYSALVQTGAIPDVLGVGANAASGTGAASGAAPAAPELLSATRLADAGLMADMFGASTPAMGGLSSLATILPAAGVAAAYGPQIYEVVDDIISGEADGNTALRGGLMSNPITAWAPPVMDALGIDMPFSSGKHQDQKIRDAIRSGMQTQVGEGENASQLVGDDWMINLADGSQYDMGIDGQDLQNVDSAAALPTLDEAGNKGIMGDTRYRHDVDWGMKDVGDYVGSLNPLSYMYSDNNMPVGMFLNAATSSGDPTANIGGFYRDSGFGRDAVYNNILERYSRGEMTQQERDAGLAETDLLYGIDNPDASEEDRQRQQANPRWGSAL